jgi:GNAT superfamily N-acetyltransferase
MPVEVVELRSEAEYREAFPVIHELHGDLEERKYLDLLGEMVPAGYHLFAIRGPWGEIFAAAGVQVLTNLYYERHLYVYDLVATEEARSEGYGGTLMDYLEELAVREGCKYVALACGRERAFQHAPACGLRFQHASGLRPSLVSTPPWLRQAPCQHAPASPPLVSYRAIGRRGAGSIISRTAVDHLWLKNAIPAASTIRATSRTTAGYGITIAACPSLCSALRRVRRRPARDVHNT